MKGRFREQLVPPTIHNNIYQNKYENSVNK